MCSDFILNVFLIFFSFSFFLSLDMHRGVYRIQRKSAKCFGLDKANWIGKAKEKKKQRSKSSVEPISFANWWICFILSFSLHLYIYNPLFKTVFNHLFSATVFFLFRRLANSYLFRQYIREVERMWKERHGTRVTSYKFFSRFMTKTWGHLYNDLFDFWNMHVYRDGSFAHVALYIV